MIEDILAPFREEDPPEWSEELLKQITEIEGSLKIDHFDQEFSSDMDDSDAIGGSPEIKPKVGTTRESLQGRNRKSYLDRHKKINKKDKF